MVIGEADAEKFVRELRGIEMGAEVALGDRDSRRSGDRVDPVALACHQPVAYGTWPVVVLVGECHEDTTATAPIASDPAQVVVHQGADSRLAPWLADRWEHDLGDEALDGSVEHFELERFLGFEVREQTALGKLQILCQDAKGDAFEPDLAGTVQCTLDDRPSG